MTYFEGMILNTILKSPNYAYQMCALSWGTQEWQASKKLSHPQ